MRLVARGREIDCGARPLVMGIVNVNDDSFSGDGTLDVGEAWEITARHVADGADVVDVGAESARTNRGVISTAEELRRLRAYLAVWRARVGSLVPRFGDQLFPPLLSLNTWRPEVVAAILPEGGDLLNDIGALPDEANARTCAATGAALLIMHSVGQPKVPHTHVGYDDVLATLDAFFAEKLELARAAGVPEDSLVLDPGIDFAKQRADNLRVFAGLRRLTRFGRPLLVPVSRKTVIGEVLGLPQPAERDAGTVACVVASQLRGGAIFRVHHARAAAEAVRTVAAVTSPAGGPAGR